MIILDLMEIEGKISGQNAFGHENSGFRSHIGNILKEYMSDFVEEKKTKYRY